MRSCFDGTEHKTGCLEDLDYGSTASNVVSFHVMDSAREIVYAPPLPPLGRNRDQSRYKMA